MRCAQETFRFPINGIIKINLSYNRVMTESVTPSLLVGNGEEGELEYITGSLRAKGVEVFTEKHRQFVKVRALPPVSAELIVDVIGETVCAFYKFRELKQLAEEYRNRDYEIYALIGALMSVEKEEELVRVAKAVRGEREIALKSLVDFRLEALKEGWSGLKELAALLLRQCSSAEDVYALVPYFLNLGDVNGIEVVSEENIRIFAADGEHVVPRFTDVPDVNAVVEVVRSRPTHVVVKEKERLSEKLLNTLRALGE